ncbi:MAG: PAS domain-containing protein [Cyanobacteria bacterium CRU_2_1]|nr:PAS domain-containing protein [Cyanobacteria bacterium CRU_2_1]
MSDGKGTPKWWDVVVTPILDEAGQVSQLLAVSRDITDRKQAEENLRQREAELLEAQRIAKIGSWNFNLETEKITWSAELFRIFGRDPQLSEPTYEELQQSIHPDDRHRHHAAVQQCIQNGISYEMEYRFFRSAGALGWLWAKGQTILNPTGQIIGLIGVALDITDRKRAEEALRESEHRFATLAEAAPVAIYRLDSTGQCVYVNDRWSEMTGRPLEEGLGESWGETIHPHDRERTAIAVAQWLQTCRAGDLYRGEARILRPDNSVIWYFCQMLPETDSSGTTIGYVGTLTDISDRKQAEAQLQNLTDRLALAVKSGAIAIWDWNVPDNILTWDDRMYELYGITPDQFASVYDAWANSLHPDDRPIAEAAIQQALAGEKDYDLEFRVVHPDGKIRFIQAAALVQRNPEGEPQHMIGINVDITDRKQAELQLLQTTAQLEASNKELEAFCLLCVSRPAIAAPSNRRFQQSLTRRIW